MDQNKKRYRVWVGVGVAFFLGSSCTKLQEWKKRLMKSPQVVEQKVKEERVVALQSRYLEKLQPSLRKKGGELVAKEDLVGQKQVLMIYAGSWHGPSRAFIGKLAEVEGSLKRAGVQVVLVSMDKDEKKMLEFMKAYQQPWYGIATESVQAMGLDFGQYKGEALPLLVWKDGEGKLLKKGVGWTLLPEIIKELGISATN